MTRSFNTSAQSRQNLRKAIGPGILVACAAIGGSHLVWSTRAGAEYGWSLVGLVLLANLLKFPFFLYGQIYAAATGESLLDGYRRQGRAYLAIFMLINILTGVINIAGVAMLTAALLIGVIPGSLTTLTLGILAVCTLLSLIGHYKLLDAVSKGVVIILTLSTVAAVIVAMMKGSPPTAAGFVPPSPWTLASFPFLVFLLGWMPAPIDLSAWSSLWIFSRSKQTGHFATPRETSIDFYLGYVMTAVLAIAFIALGKLVMYGTGASFANGAIGFSNQLIGLYAANIGAWSKPLILTAAFATMFSTTQTCVDGYPRALAACCEIFSERRANFNRLHQGWIILSVAGAMLIVGCFAKSLLQHLSFAAAVSFLTSPILAAINLKVMYGSNVPKEYRPGWLLGLISWCGMVGFVGMSVGYIYVEFLR